MTLTGTFFYAIMVTMDKYLLEFDGACWPNPGTKAGWGYILYKISNLYDLPNITTIVAENAGIIPNDLIKSNNYAEYYALAEGLERFLYNIEVKENSGEETLNSKDIRLDIYGDSKLVINQLIKYYSLKCIDHPKYRDKIYVPQALRTFELIQQIYNLGITCTFNWIPREKNTECDELSKKYLAASIPLKIKV